MGKNLVTLVANASIILGAISAAPLLMLPHATSDALKTDSQYRDASEFAMDYIELTAKSTAIGAGLIATGVYLKGREYSSR